MEFAKTSKTGDIAKMSLSPGGKEHSITATSESFIGKLFRSSTTKEANNYARTIFKESIAKMFGGEDHIPDSVKGDEFNRLAKLDYGKFDNSEGYKIYNRKVDMPDGSRQFRENKLEKVVDSFAQEFKVNASCYMDFTMTLNPTDEELMAAEIAKKR